MTQYILTRCLVDLFDYDDDDTESLSAWFCRLTIISISLGVCVCVFRLSFCFRWLSGGSFFGLIHDDFRLSGSLIWTMYLVVLIKLVYGSSHVQHCIQHDHMYRLCGGVEMGLMIP